MFLHPRLPVSAETRRRWARRGEVPALAAFAMQLLRGDLGKISQAWDGWQLEGDVLRAPNGDRWDPDFLQAWAYERQELAELKRRLGRSEQRRLF